MGFWTYYSPLGLGLVLTLVLHEAVYAQAPVSLPAWAYWPFVAGVGVGVGLLCQLLLIGVQGTFAQVLPVPVGRSIRGRGAVLGGGLIVGCVLLAVVAALLRSEEVSRAALVVGVASLACGVGAMMTYIWCWPTALRDFGKRAR